MSKLLIGLITFLLLSSVALAGTFVGKITNVQGQRVTIMDDSGFQVIITTNEAQTLQVGDKVSVEHEEIGDALLATKVILLAQ